MARRTDRDIVTRYVIITLGASSFRPVRDITYLQNIIFLLSESDPKLGKKARYMYTPMGVHSKAVEEIVNDLTNNGFIENKNGRLYLSGAGTAPFYSFLEDVTGRQYDTVVRRKEFMNDLTPDEMLSLIHSCYPAPEYDRHCRVMADRVRHAVRMYESGKIGMKRAAQVSGMTYDDFSALLCNKPEEDDMEKK